MSPEKRVQWERERRRGYAWYVLVSPFLCGLLMSYVPGLVAIGILGNRNGWREFIEVHAIKAVLLFIVFWYIRKRQWSLTEREYLAGCETYDIEQSGQPLTPISS